MKKRNLGALVFNLDLEKNEITFKMVDELFEYKSKLKDVLRDFGAIMLKLDKYTS